MLENPGHPAEFIDVYWPYVDWFIIGLMCGAAFENWARRSYFNRKGKSDDDDHESAS